MLCRHVKVITRCWCNTRLCGYFITMLDSIWNYSKPWHVLIIAGCVGWRDLQLVTQIWIDYSSTHTLHQYNIYSPHWICLIELHGHLLFQQQHKFVYGGLWVIKSSQEERHRCTSVVKYKMYIFCFKII